MDVKFSEIIIPEAVDRIVDTAHITGDIPLPSPAKQILSCSGKVNVKSCETAQDKVFVEGSLCLDIICEGANNDLFSFTSSAAFHHTMEAKGTSGIYCGKCTAQITHIDLSLDGDMLTLNSDAEIFCRIEDMSKKSIITKSSDTEIMSKTVLCSYSELAGTVKDSVREEISADNIKEIIQCQAEAHIRDTTQNGESITVSGMICTDIVYISKSNHYEQLFRNIPFTVQVISDTEDAKISAKAEVTDIRMRLSQDEYGFATATAEIKVSVYKCTQKEITITTDAFSPTSPFACEKKKVQFVLYRQSVQQKAVFHDTVMVNDIINEPIVCKVHPTITSATMTCGGITVDGIAQCTVIGISKQTGFRSVNDELPFSVTLPTECKNAEIDANILCLSAAINSVSENGVEITMTLCLCADIYELYDTEIAMGAVPCEKPDVPKGIIVCFAGNNDTLYDISKRFNLPQSTVCEAFGKNEIECGDRGIWIE